MLHGLMQTPGAWYTEKSGVCWKQDLVLAAGRPRGPWVTFPSQAIQQGLNRTSFGF